MKTQIPQRLCLALPAALLAAAVHAEDAEDPAPEKITVVGTSIKQTPIDEPYAVDVTNRDDLADQGAPRLTDLIRNLGASHGVVGERSSWYNSGQGGAIMESVANVNLRGLGASRTLVLINGRRQVYVPTRLIGGRFVDINVVPAIALGRMEVLKEGAGAIYGSDAVGGIANFVTRHDFDGFETAVSRDHFDDAGDTLLAGIWGGAVGDDAHLVVAVEHGRRQELRAEDRSWSLRELQSPWRAAFSSVGNPGHFRFPDLDRAAESFGRTELSRALGAAPQRRDPRCEDLGGHASGDNCLYRYQTADNLIEKTRHTNLFAELSGPLTDRSDYHLEALWSEAVIPDWRATPSWPLFQWLDRGLQEVGANHPGRQKFCADYGSDADLAARCADDSAWYFYGRPFGNSGPDRFLRRDTRTWRLAAGVDGDFDLADRLIDYDVNLSYSHSSANNRFAGIYAERLFLAYRGYGGPNCGVGVVADAAAAPGMRLGDTGGRAPGTGDCMYYNPFSNAIQYSVQAPINLPNYALAGRPNPDYRADLANSPELHAWLHETVNPNDEAELLVGDVTFSGSLWEDTAGFALGYMYRRFEARGEPDSLSSLPANPCPVVGDRGCLPEGQSTSPQERGIYTWTNTYHPYDETHTSHRVFGELALALGEDLDVQLAANYEDSEDNSSLDPKVGLRYRLTDAVSLRGSAQTTFRTPSTDDLNSGAPLTTLEYISTTGAWLQVEKVGDDSIDPEEAFTYNLGVVVQTDGGTELTVDYWSYDFEDVIAGLPSDAIDDLYGMAATKARVQQYVYCSDGLGTGSCTAAEIIGLRTPLVNWPGVKTSGFDWHVMRPFELERGELTLDFSGTYTIEYDIDDLTLAGETLLAGYDAAGKLNFGHALAPPIPDWKGRLSAVWRWSDYTLAGHVNYISSYDDVVSPTDRRKIDSHTTLDLTFRWQLPERGLNLAASVLNVTDEDPPFVNVEHGYDGLTHDGKGIRFKLGLTYSF